MGLDVASPVPSLSLLWMQSLDAWVWRRGEWNVLLCCSSCSASFGTGTVQIHTAPWASHTLVTFDLQEGKNKGFLFHI